MIVKILLFLTVIATSFAAGWFARKPVPPPVNVSASVTEEKAQSETTEDRVTETEIVSAEGVKTKTVIRQKILVKEDKHSNADIKTSIPVIVPDKRKKYSLLLGAELSKDLLQKDYRPGLVLGAGYNFNSTLGVQAQYSVKHKEVTAILETNF